MAARAVLDIPEQQVALAFHDDLNITWHHRVLWFRIGDTTRYVAGSPDWENEIVDLTEFQVVPLIRAALPPARIIGDFYQFAARPTDAQLDAARADARALASLFGSVAAAKSVDAGWFFADMAGEKFGEEVGASFLQNVAAHVMRGSVGLVQTEDGWTTMERVLRSDLDAWKSEKQNGPGRDPRLLEIQKDPQGARFAPLREAMSKMKSNLGTSSPYRGPSALPELLETVRATGDDLVGYHDFFLRSSGLSPESPVAHQHKCLMSVLAHMVHFDQLNAYGLSSGECIGRNILRIHRAVRRNPKAPDFKGLDVMISNRLDLGGAAFTGDFAKWTAEEQKNEAFTMKQQRLYSEEVSKKPSGVAASSK